MNRINTVLLISALALSCAACQSNKPDPCGGGKNLEWSFWKQQCVYNP